MFATFDRPMRLPMRVGYLVVAVLLAGLAIAPVAVARIDRFGADGAALPSAAYHETRMPWNIGHYILW